MSISLHASVPHAVAMAWFLVRFLGPAVAQAESVACTPDRDATLFENETGSIASGSGPTLFVGDNRTLNTRRAVLHFDVNGVLPPGATVQGVELWVHVSDAPDTTPRSVAVHRLSSDWGEGASASAGGGGAPAQSGDATWLHRYYPDVEWTDPGGDYDPSSSAIAVLEPSGWHVWSSEVLVQDVQGWLDDPAINFGWLLEGEEGTASSARGIDSRESEQPELRPYLQIEYQDVGVSTEMSSWSRIKVGF